MTEDLFGNLVVYTVLLLLALGAVWMVWTIYVDSL